MNNNMDDNFDKKGSNNQQGLNDLHDVLNSEESIYETSIDEFDEEAAEGLQQISNDKIPSLVNEINRSLKSHLKSKKRLKKVDIDQSAVVITIVTLLIIIVLAYIVIKKFL